MHRLQLNKGENDEKPSAVFSCDFFVVSGSPVYGEFRIPFALPVIEKSHPSGWQSALIKMCDVLPGMEVESLSPFDKPFNKATPHARWRNMRAVIMILSGKMIILR